MWSGTAERLLKVAFDVKVGGKVERGFLVVAQTSPTPTPPPAPVYPVGHKRLSNPVVQTCSLPVGEAQAQVPGARNLWAGARHRGMVGAPQPIQGTALGYRDPAFPSPK
ncbi:hypothetical protein E2C01_098852 [Portunus trituberculatus]|uniref:Uncharacterized protein n=1 Tax=Portunus trituberculatus TaxID=210409 RepID=A0A5B7K9G4_PORTR|nr:hypothetical protein [Portunus trituberculatus]